jgi:hypothetical protein
VHLWQLRDAVSLAFGCGRVHLEPLPVLLCHHLSSCRLGILHHVGCLLRNIWLRYGLHVDGMFVMISRFFISSLSLASTLNTSIVVCSQSSGGFVTRFLAHPLWTPLSRLVYGAYLVHPMIIYGLFYTMNSVRIYSDPSVCACSFCIVDQKYDYTPYRQTADFIAMAFGAFSVSVVGHLLIEKPFNNIQKIVIPAGR